MHPVAGSREIQFRVFVPQAEQVSVINSSNGHALCLLDRVHDAGFFLGAIPARGKPRRYRFKVTAHGAIEEIEDPYRFGPTLGELDLHLHPQGNHLRSYEKLGAHPMTLDGVEGTAFAVWAPNAKRVSVVGNFNSWDGRRHPMRLHTGAGIWDVFLPGIKAGERYKFEVKTRQGEILLKADPYAFEAELSPRTASIVQPAQNREQRTNQPPRSDRRSPISIYEVHLGSWRRAVVEGNRSLSYRELAHELVAYVKDMGFTHIELMPIAEYPFDGSWGYQPTGLFAPTSRYGSPDDFKAFVDACHEAGIGLIADWVAAHFPSDAHGLAHFDGTNLYEHADPREGYHPDWNTLIYNFGRNEVRNFLTANALYWLDRFGVDGLRVDAVASMIYRNYSRKDGEWIPNVHGGVENLEAIDFLKRTNEAVYAAHPNAMMIAEESTAWPMVSRPTYAGGLGFGYKWNLGWMHDTLSYMSKDPIHRRYHHDALTFGLLYAFHENFILPLSHDEVVHGKGSLLSKMSGDRWQKFANLRAYFGFMYTQPGKKLLFMGGEFAQECEWDHNRSLDWHLLGDAMHSGMQRLVRDLNLLYRSWPALHELDCEVEGFSWIDCHDSDNSVISYLRRGEDPSDFAVIVCNFTPVVRHAYRIGVPRAGGYTERINTDSVHYGGSDVGNGGHILAEDVPAHGHSSSLSLTVPPLSTLILAPNSA